MGNLVAVLAHCGRGDEVLLATYRIHFLNEAGGISALGGVHPRTLPVSGGWDADAGCDSRRDPPAGQRALSADAPDRA